MNHVPLLNRYAKEIARIREVVSRHPFPDFVTGFDVEFGEFDGDPAMWIVFHTTGQPSGARAMMEARGKALLDLQRAVQDDLLGEIDDRYPYFRSAPAPDNHSGRD